MTAVVADDVLQWWFADADDDLDRLKARQQVWFQGQPEVDASIRERFGATLIAASRGEHDNWASTPRGRLALIIVLDQFSRNLCRGSVDAFGNDPKAYQCCMDGIERGDDLTLGLAQRMFFYLPLEHAEDMDAQVRSLQCYEAVVAMAPEELKDYFLGTLQFATLHYDIIKRFGRFPHRNAVLRRQSTAAEQEYLDGDAPRFGQ